MSYGKVKPDSATVGRRAVLAGVEPPELEVSGVVAPGEHKFI